MTDTELIRFKTTNRVLMGGNTEFCRVTVDGKQLDIPMKVAFQVKRGLESYIQKFYRKHDKKTV